MIIEDSPFILMNFLGVSLETVIYYIVFLILVGIPLYLEKEQIPDRLNDIRNNYKSVIYAPISILILFSSLIFALLLAEQFSILYYGWLGENIAVSPAADSVEAVENTNSLPIFEIFKFVVFISILLLAMLVFNYIEEEMFRDNYKEVLVWALLHLIMGIPILTIIPIFSVGVFYKILRDKKGLGAAYVAHLTTNLFIVSTLFIRFLIAVV